jgi:hypothetical protein
MTQLMKFAMTKAYFEKADVVKLIETLPEYFQEDALLIATNNYKAPDYCRVGTAGVINGVTYFVTRFNPFEGVTVQNVNNAKDTCIIAMYKSWEKYVNAYTSLREKRKNEYLKKLHKLQEEYKDLD